jgi:ribosome-associated protein
MDEPLVVRGSIAIPANELRWRTSRSGGPGGQNVNKRDTRVELSFDLASTHAVGAVRRERALGRLASRLRGGVLTVASSEERTQGRNRALAREKLAAILHEAFAPPPRARRPTRPTKASVERRLEDKRRRSETKRRRGAPVG